MTADWTVPHPCPRCGSEEAQRTGRPVTGGAQILADGQKYRMVVAVQCLRCGQDYARPVD